MKSVIRVTVESQWNPTSNPVRTMIDTCFVFTLGPFPSPCLNLAAVALLHVAGEDAVKEASNQLLTNFSQLVNIFSACTSTVKQIPDGYPFDSRGSNMAGS
jgi:hypothetical protein